MSTIEWWEWLKRGAAPPLPDGWSWTRNVLEARCGVVVVDHCDEALTVYVDTHDIVDATIPVAVVNALIEARFSWYRQFSQADTRVEVAP